MTHTEEPDLLASLPAAVYTVNPGGYITYFNRSASDLWGRSPRRGIDQWCGSFRLFMPDGTPLAHDACPMAIAVKEQRPVRGAEAIAERPDGSRINFVPYPTPLHDAAGRLTGAVNVLIDITERKRAELALREADRRKDAFLAMLGHELSNPLAALLPAVQSLQAMTAEQPQLTSVSGVIGRQVAQLTRLSGDLMDVERIKSGRLELRLAAFDLRAAVDDAIEMCRPHLDDYRHCLQLDLSATALPVYADQARLIQVFANLLHNACRYTPPDGLLRLAAARDGADVVVRVVESGIGIDPAFLPRVFEAFERAPNARAYVNSGLGIGLMLVKQIVELHGGSVQASSAGLERGSEFIVRLPAAAGTVDALPAATAVPAVSNFTPLRVLLVEDEKDIRQSLSQVLVANGHHVQCATNGTEALGLAAAFEPDAILLDIGLPGMDGYEVARQLRLIPALARVRIVAMSGLGQAGDRATAKSAIMDDHLIKPAGINEIETVLARCSAS